MIDTAKKALDEALEKVYREAIEKWGVETAKLLKPKVHVEIPWGAKEDEVIITVRLVPYWEHNGVMYE